MTFRELTVLLPCQSLENLSLSRDAREAEELLAGWSALYHPVLLGQAENMPKWTAAETPPEPTGDCLIILPGCCDSQLPSDWLARAEAAGARVLRGMGTRERMIAAALEGLAEPAHVDPDLVADFLALGFCHFQVELLTRQLRYMSNLDQERFGQHTRDAARAALAGDAVAAREQLRGAFDRLTEAREYFYPVETHLLDLTLAATTTLGEALRTELAAGLPVNLLISAEVLEEMARSEPDTLAKLREGLERGDVTLIGGEYAEQELPLLALEDILAGFRSGLAGYQRHLGRQPTIYGRRRFGLTPLLPAILRNLGFEGALHFTLDDGRFPKGNQSKIRWEGFDGTEIEALARIPIDVAQPDSYLRLSERLGNTMDLDSAATTVFAHWPGQSSPWHDDLRRMARYGPVLGRFGAMAQYFQSTLNAGRSTAYAPSKYRSPYLRQAVAAGQPDPISRWVRYHQERAELDALQTLSTLDSLITGGVAEADQPAGGTGPDDVGVGSPQQGEGLSARLEKALSRFCELVAGPSRQSSGGFLVANSCSFPRRLCLDVSRLEDLPETAGPILMAGESAQRKQVVVEVPAMGFAWVGPDPATTPAEPKKKPKQQEPVARQYELRNEFFEVKFNPQTGAIQGIHNYAMRGNRLGQQIAMRLADPSRARRQGAAAGGEEEYSVMAADELTVAEAGPLVGRIESRGRLLDREGRLLARFLQSAQARRGSRVLELEIELDIERLPESDAWDSYYASRFAWADETADLYQSVGLTGRACEENFLEAPHFLDVRTPRTRLTILTGGLPYHRRFGLRKLDTLLVVAGERARQFRLGIGVDLTYGARAALDFLDPKPQLVRDCGPPPGSTAWLFHLSARNVIATQWEPIAREGGSGGFRVRLLETEGRHARLTLRSFRPLAAARKVDFLGEGAIDLAVQGDGFEISLGPHQWTQVEAEFAP
jgi:alpha-mannosidase